MSISKHLRTPRKPCFGICTSRCRKGKALSEHAEEIGCLKVQSHLHYSQRKLIFLPITGNIRSSWCGFCVCMCMHAASVNFDASCFSPILLMNSICLQPQGKLVTRNFLLSFQLKISQPQNHCNTVINKLREATLEN